MEMVVSSVGFLISLVFASWMLLIGARFAGIEDGTFGKAAGTIILSMIIAAIVGFILVFIPIIGSIIALFSSLIVSGIVMGIIFDASFLRSLFALILSYIVTIIVVGTFWVVLFFGLGLTIFSFGAQG